MAGSNWQQLAGGSVNPYDIRRDDGTLTADYGEHIISDGGTVTLPSPKGDEAVLVSNISQDTTVTTSTGLVEQQSDVTHSSTTSGPVLFVSDGSDWYVANNLDYISTIPDTVVEDSEWGGPVSNRYTATDGDINDWSIDSNDPLREGNNSLKYDATQGGNIVSNDGDGSNYYPEVGDEVWSWMQVTSGGGSPQTGIFVPTDSDVRQGHSAEINDRDDEFNIYVDGTTPVVTVAQNWTVGQWYLVRFDTAEDNGDFQTRVRVHDGPDFEDDDVIINETHTDANSNILNNKGFGFGDFRNYGSAYDPVLAKPDGGEPNI